jgi:hypothetical protein
MDDEFVEGGVILEGVSSNIYRVKDCKGKEIIRHSSQLRGFKQGDVV